MSAPAFGDIDSLIATAKSNLPYVITPEVKTAAQSIAFNPFFWNLIGRIEFKSHIFTKLAGSKYRACYGFAFVVFTLGLVRDYLYYEALKTQPTSPWLANDAAKLVGIVTAGIGHILAISSMWALGITGTYLGDYFGILMDEKVDAFPFNVCDNPMYTGSFLTFLGIGIYEGKALGVGLSLLVWVIYWLGLQLEEPFTAKIYSEREKLE